MTTERWVPTHRHLKTGGLYKKLMEGLLESNISEVVIYQDGRGRVWVRSKSEFCDGRFAVITPAEAVLHSRWIDT